MTTRVLAALLAATLALAGCSSDKKSPPPGPSTSGGAGLGSSNAAPTGTALSVPTGIAFGTITGDTSSCGTGVFGNGDYVNLCVPIVNSTGAQILVTFPAGLVFVSTSLDTQNGMLLQPVQISVPGSTTLHVRFDLFCLNAERAGSSTLDVYTVGPDTDVAALNELIALVSWKALSVTPPAGSMPAGYEAAEDWPAYDLVQYMAWVITEGGALTTADKAAIAALPDDPELVPPPPPPG